MSNIERTDREIAEALVNYLETLLDQDKTCISADEYQYSPRTLAAALRERQEPISSICAESVRKRAKKLGVDDPIELIKRNH
jgi:hypothetical protein